MTERKMTADETIAELTRQRDDALEDLRLFEKRGDRLLSTLRDRFAQSAFNGMRSSGYDNTREVIAAEAYKDADAMLAARGGGQWAAMEEFITLVAAGPDFHLNDYTRTLQDKAKEILAAKGQGRD